MAHLAELSELNGDVTPFTYGTVPNDPYRWDYDKLQGCKCDEGYEGHDCSLRSCPLGDDPRTQWYTRGQPNPRMRLPHNELNTYLSYGNHLPEIQALTCVTGDAAAEAQMEDMNSLSMVGNSNQAASLSTADFTEAQLLTNVVMLQDGQSIADGSATDSTFRLSFRCGKFNNVQIGTINPACTTDPISHSATEEEIKLALEKLKTIGGGVHEHNNHDSGKVDVKFTTKWELLNRGFVPKVKQHNWKKKCKTPLDCVEADVACTEDGSNVIVITFKSEFGDLPSLIPSHAQYMHALHVKVDTDGKGKWSQRGTKEKKVCSGRGLCDHGTGQCGCASGYGSSDGFGKAGTRGDCGHSLPYVGGAGGGAAF
jgi:hypothetical protein